jgi:putative ABC transport system permease protein
LETYVIPINGYDLAFIGTIFLGSGLAVLLWFAKRQNKAANRLLAMGLLIFVIHLLRLLFMDVFPASRLLSQWVPLQYTIGLGPMLFFYVLKITRPKNTFKRKDLLHLMPLAVGLGMQLVTHQLDLLLQLAAFLSLIIYLYAAYHLTESFYQRIKFVNGDRYRTELKWLQRLLIAFGLLCLCFTVCISKNYFYDHSRIIAKAFYSFDLLLAYLTIAWACIALSRLDYAPASSAPAFVKELIPSALKEKGIWLKRMLKVNAYYQDPELTLPLLAEKLSLHSNELSKIINTVFRKNFNDFINEYRIAVVIQRMRDKAYDHLTLLGIAFESGFNSKTTFNRAFKQMTGHSPAAYKIKYLKERPNYNLERQINSSGVILNRGSAQNWTGTKSNRNIMLKNYFKIAWRNLVRNKSYATINVTGLAIGIASCLLIFLVVQYQISFDTFHTKRDRIYRVLTGNTGPEGTHAGAGTPLPLVEGLKLDYPQIKQFANIMKNDGSHYAVDNGRKGEAAKKFKEDLSYYADPGFFQMFDFKWLAGDKNTALAEPNTIVLSRDQADKFFGDWRTAMGKIVRKENKLDLKVTGILENSPVNTDFPIKIVVSWTTLVSKGGDLYNNITDWVSTFGDRNCYLVLPPELNERQFNKQLVSFAKKHIPAPYNKTEIFQLQALKNMHFDTEAGTYSGRAFSKELISVISMIGLFLLIIACVNFINLATAQAVNRSKEVGIRKVLGSNRGQLILQFISETFLITLFAVILASIISLLTLPLLNDLLEIELSMNFLARPVVLLFLAAVLIGVTILAGFYPALVLSGFNPLQALKNKVNASSIKGISLRRVLVVTQFSIAQILVIGTLVLIYQMNYFKNKSLGFNKDAVITVPLPGDSISKTRIDALRNQLLQQPGIKGISASLSGPSDNGGWYSDFKFDNSPNQVNFAAAMKWADPEYFKLYNIQFVAGGSYAATDTVSGYVVNETMVHKLGLKDPKQAIGKYIILWNNKKLYAQIKGVVKDYNIGSLRGEIPPVLMGPWKEHYGKLNIKLAPQNIRQTLASVEGLWNKTYPEGIYEYQFLDKTIADFYKNEDQLATLYKIFAGIAIFISCLGLYGLVSFMAVQRTKEVGIRKTLGASIQHIVYLFSKEFTILIVIAFLISAPVGYYLMHKWLQDYTYRIDIGPEIFILAIVTSIAIAWTSVGYRAVKAALANPVKSLRSE